MNTNYLRELAEDLHSSTGHNPIATALSLAADEIDRLRDENEKYRLTIKFYQAKMDDLHDERMAQVSKLCAELTEARKPDCRTCWHFEYNLVGCSLKWRSEPQYCTGANLYKTRDPVRLYEKEGKV